jgi:hypothetical protein
VSYNFESCLPAGEGSEVSRVLRLWILPPYREGSVAATTYSTVSFGPQTLNIKKSLAGLFLQQCPPILNLHAHVSKSSNVRVIMGLQDVRVGTTINTCKMCVHAATVPL